MATAMLLLMAGAVAAQKMTTHKVKKRETIYGIARSYGITETELRKANPGMEDPDFVLKSGKKINIPLPQQYTSETPQVDERDATDDIRLRPIRMGVMLPLHDKNGDGRRMVEYYRGLLMALDSLKHEGISADVYAWNVPDDADISQTLSLPEAAQCDIIFGPLYSRYMDQLSAFCQQHGTMLVIPFSINAPQIDTNKHIFQIYQPADELSEVASLHFSEWFVGAHPIIVDCDDPQSKKGVFTAALRKDLEYHNIRYSLTSLRTANNVFASAFSTQRNNVVVLNSARTSDLEELFVKLKDLATLNPAIKVSVFGYLEWLELAELHQANFHRFDMHLPSPWLPGLSPMQARKLTQKYQANFKRSMSTFTPPLAITGFDHAFFFLRGLHKYGRAFDGAQGRFGYQPVQTPLKFERVSATGGYRNRAFMFVHYKPDMTIETISY